MLKKENYNELLIILFSFFSFFSILRITLLENIPHFNGFIIFAKSLIDSLLLVIILSNILYLFYYSVKKSFQN